jgi:hypothetical protein
LLKTWEQIDVATLLEAQRDAQRSFDPLRPLDVFLP